MKSVKLTLKGITLTVECPQLKLIEDKLDIIIRKEIHMSKELDELQAAVEENTTVDQSIMTLVDKMAATIESMKNDPVKLAAFAKALRDSSAATVAKVLANTPQEPPNDPEV